MDSIEALQHFGTATLGYDVMCQMIVVRPRERCLDATRWIAAVPAAYREAVLAAVVPACELFLSEETRKATTQTIDALIRCMHGAVIRTVEPVLEFLLFPDPGTLQHTRSP